MNGGAFLIRGAFLKWKCSDTTRILRMTDSFTLYSLGRGNSTGRVSPANKKISQIGRVSPGGRVSPETTQILRLDRGRVSEARFSGNFPKTDLKTPHNQCFLCFSGASRQILTRRALSNAKFPEFPVSGGVEFPQGVEFPRGSGFPGNNRDLKMT